MATGTNITNFTAADIEKYHKGLLSFKEMHDLEKAALDDPFLADALEGYTVTGKNTQADIAELENRLGQRVEGAKVIPLSAGKNKPIPWLRIAALLIIISGTAVLANQFIFKGKNNKIAKNEVTKTGEVKAPDSSVNPAVPVTTGTKETVSPAVKDQQQANGTTKVTEETAGIISGKEKTSALSRTDDVTPKTEAVTVTTNPGSGAIPITTGGAEDKFKAAEKSNQNKEGLKEETKALAKNEKRNDADKDGVKDQFDIKTPAPQKKTNAPITPNRNVSDEQRANAGLFNQSNIFRGRVTDSNNVGVPFANVTNAQDNNAGTYTDAKGYFTLTYPDSVVDVQVRSIGFENRSFQLNNTAPNNQVVLQDDRRSLSEVVINNQKPNAAARSREANNTMKLEEPEPADGWDNYDAYLANNLNEPEEIKTKQNNGGQVQVSFEVNKDGEPVNIKVEKSLCAK
ncbi:MAG: carboxypeptidase-like regulatory domain-containing protein, partial [Bacteroidota bacterium]